MEHTQQGVIAPITDTKQTIVNGAKQGFVAPNQQFLQLQTPDEAILKQSDHKHLADLAAQHAYTITKNSQSPPDGLLLPALFIAHKAHPDGKSHSTSTAKAQEAIQDIADAFEGKASHPIVEAISPNQNAIESFPHLKSAHPDQSLVDQAQAHLPLFRQLLKQKMSTAQAAEAMVKNGMQPKSARLALQLVGRGDTMVGDDHQIKSLFGLSHQDHSALSTIKDLFEQPKSQQPIHQLVDMLAHSSPLQRTIDEKLQQPELLPAKAFYLGLTPEEAQANAQNKPVQQMAQMRNKAIQNLTPAFGSGAADYLANQRFLLAQQLLSRPLPYQPSTQPNAIKGAFQSIQAQPVQSRFDDLLQQAKQASDVYGAYGTQLKPDQTHAIAKLVSGTQRLRKINKDQIRLTAPKPNEAEQGGQPEYMRSVLEQIHQANENHSTVHPQTVQWLDSAIKSQSPKLLQQDPQQTDNYLQLLRAQQSAQQVNQNSQSFPKEKAPFQTDYFQSSNLNHVHQAAKNHQPSIEKLQSEPIVSNSQLREALAIASQLPPNIKKALDHVVHQDIEGEDKPEGLYKNLHSLSIMKQPFYRHSPVMRHGHHSKYGSPALVYSYYSRVVPAWLRHHNASKGAASLHMPHKLITHGFPHMRKSESDSSEVRPAENAVEPLALAKLYVPEIEVMMTNPEDVDYDSLNKSALSMALEILPSPLKQKLANQIARFI